MNTPTITKPAAAAQLPSIPFTRAALPQVQPGNVDVSTVMSASSTQLGPYDVPAIGFLRHLFVQVSASGGTGTAAVYKEDAPFSAISEIALTDVNGAPIVGPISGYDLYLINKYGGYSGFADPKSMPSYTTPTSGNFAFCLRVPVELGSRDGVGSLPNMNASSTYKLRITQAATTDVFSTNPTGLPTLRFQVFTEAWSGPLAMGPNGESQATVPPAEGTTQMWSKMVLPAAAAFNTLQLRRVGNYIRNIIVVGRNTSDGLRSDTNLPSTLQWFLDNGQWLNESQVYRKQQMRERLVGQTNGPDTGVLVYDFTSEFDGLYGGELRNWLPTIQSTRLELQGTFAAAQNVTILTNDVAVKGNPFI